MQTKLVLPLAVVFVIAAITGCDDPKISQDVVTITYEQVGSCNGYSQTTGPGGSGPHHLVSPGPKAAYVAFRIVTIDNSKSTKDFNFDPERIFVTTDPRAFMDSSLTLARDLGVFAAVPVNVPKGQNQGNNGITVAVVRTAANDACSEANGTNYFLQYDVAATDPVVQLVKKNANQTTWPQQSCDCHAIPF